MNDFQKVFSWLLTAIVGLAVIGVAAGLTADAITTSPPIVAVGIIAVVLFLLVAAGFGIFQSLKGRTRPQLQRRRYRRGSR